MTEPIIPDAISTEIQVPEPYNTQIDALTANVGLPSGRVRDIKLRFADAFIKVSEWEAEAASIVVTSEADKAAMKQAGTLRKAIKKIRTGTNKIREAGKAEAKAEIKLWDGLYTLIEDLVTPIEEALAAKEKFGDKIEAERKAKLVEDRKSLLQALNYPTAGLALGEMSEADFNLHLDKAMATADSQPVETPEPEAEPVAVNDSMFSGLASLSEPKPIEVAGVEEESTDSGKLRRLAETFRKIEFPFLRSDSAAALVKEASGYIGDLIPRLNDMAFQLEAVDLKENPPKPLEWPPAGTPDPLSSDPSDIAKIGEMVADAGVAVIDILGPDSFGGEDYTPETVAEATKPVDPLGELATTSQVLTLKKLAEQKETDLDGIVSEKYGITLAEITRRQAMELDMELRSLADPELPEVTEPETLGHTEPNGDVTVEQPELIVTVDTDSEDDDEDDGFDLSEPWNLPSNHPNYVDPTTLPKDHPAYVPF